MKQRRIFLDSSIKIDRTKLLKETYAQNKEVLYTFLFAFIVVGEDDTEICTVNRFGAYTKPLLEFEIEDYPKIMEFLEFNYITEGQEDDTNSEDSEEPSKSNESSENSENSEREVRQKNFKKLVLLGITPWGKYKEK